MSAYLLPMIAAVIRPIKPTGRSVRRRVNAPRRPACLPKRCKNRLRSRRFERHIDCCGVFIAKEDFLPALPSIYRTEDAALLVRPVGMTQCSDENFVCIPRVHYDSPDLSRILQPDVRPCLAAVRGLVHPIPVGNRGTHVGFAGAHV